MGRTGWKGATARLAVVAAALLTIGAACQPPPPEFYEPPSSLPDDPGDIIDTVETTFGNRSDVSATAVSYRSTSATGEPNHVTGTVLVPEAPWTGDGHRPIVSFAVGTQGLSDGCAASQTLPSGTIYELANIEGMIDRGWAVAVTDYEKLGTPGDHTYVIKDAEGHAVLDIVRAAQQLPDAGISADAPVAVWGYSQGGQAAAAAAELEASYAPELDVVGVAAGGVPADLGRVAEHLNGPGNLFFTFLAFAAVGLDSAYPELDLESYLNQTGRDMLEQGRDACLVDGLFLGAFQTTDSVTHTDPLDEPDWQARIAEQQLGRTAPEVPVYQYHGLFDEIIPYDQAATLRDDWCAGGTQVQWTDYVFAEHLLGMFFAAGDVTNWLDARFAGQAPTPTCNA